MLFLLTGALALTWCWFLVGRSFAAMTRPRPPSWDTFEMDALVGAFIMAVVSQAVHFVVPLPSKPSAAVVAAVLVALTVLRRSDSAWLLRGAGGLIREHPTRTALFGVFAVVVGLAAARACKVEDTGLYHAPLLQWTESARLVPGLALLHGRLGFNSLWFPLEAVVSFAFLTNGPLPLANTTVFLLGASYLVRQALSDRSDRLIAHLAIAALVPYVVVGFLYAGSQSPDLPALTYGLLACFAAVSALERLGPHHLLVVALASASVAWKLSSLPLLLWIPIVVGDRARTAARQWDRFALGTAALVVVAGVLTIARSVVLSGYPFFPSTMVDVFAVDWKAPAWLAHGQEMWVHAWARGLHRGNPQETLTYPLQAWVPLWVANWSSLNRFLIPLLAAAIVLFPLSLVVPLTRGPARGGLRRGWGALAVVSLSGAAFWFWQAPDVRFGGSYLTALFAALCVPWLAAIDRVRPARQLVPVLALVGAAAMVAQNLLMAPPLPPWVPAAYAEAHPGRFHWLFPAPYPEATFTLETLGDGSTNAVVANGGLAHYGPVPNSPLPVAGHAVRRGAALGDGFRLDSGSRPQQ